jgi:hypothetical protein
LWLWLCCVVLSDSCDGDKILEVSGITFQLEPIQSLEMSIPHGVASISF